LNFFYLASNLLVYHRFRRRVNSIISLSILPIPPIILSRPRFETNQPINRYQSFVSGAAMMELYSPQIWRSLVDPLRGVEFGSPAPWKIC